MRHTFATHAALLGANPLRLQHWLGHATLNITLRYVHFAEAHAWPIADEVLTAGANLLHPDRRLVAQLGARPHIEPRGNSVPTKPARRATSAFSRRDLVGAARIEGRKASASRRDGAGVSDEDGVGRVDASGRSRTSAVANLATAELAELLADAALLLLGDRVGARMLARLIQRARFAEHGDGVTPRRER